MNYQPSTDHTPRRISHGRFLFKTVVSAAAFFLSLIVIGCSTSQTTSPRPLDAWCGEEELTADDVAEYRDSSQAEFMEFLSGNVHSIAATRQRHQLFQSLFNQHAASSKATEEPSTTLVEPASRDQSNSLHRFYPECSESVRSIAPTSQSSQRNNKQVVIKVLTPLRPLGSLIVLTNDDAKGVDSLNCMTESPQMASLLKEGLRIISIPHPPETTDEIIELTRELQLRGLASPTNTILLSDTARTGATLDAITRRPELFAGAILSIRPTKKPSDFQNLPPLAMEQRSSFSSLLLIECLSGSDTICSRRDFLERIRQLRCASRQSSIQITTTEGDQDKKSGLRDAALRESWVLYVLKSVRQ